MVMFVVLMRKPFRNAALDVPTISFVTSRMWYIFLKRAHFPLIPSVLANLQACQPIMHVDSEQQLGEVASLVQRIVNINWGRLLSLDHILCSGNRSRTHQQRIMLGLFLKKKSRY